MNKLKFSFTLFAILSILQLAIPVWMIANREMTLRHGRLFRFRTAPVDPYDAFRGRFVALQVSPNSAPLSNSEELAANKKAFAQLGEDNEGFAKIIAVSTNRLTGSDYVACRVNSFTDSLVYLQFSFDRYYMEEHAASAAEAAYREHSRGEVQDVYVAVRVKDGDAIVEELFIAGMPIREFVSKNQE